MTTTDFGAPGFWPEDDEEDDRWQWLATWAPRCPFGYPQAARRCLGYHEREPGRLQVRYAQRSREGLCPASAEEHDDAVYVRVRACEPPDTDEDDREPDNDTDEYINCPAHVYLERPLGDRRVVGIDTDGDGELPLFVADW